MALDETEDTLELFGVEATYDPTIKGYRWEDGTGRAEVTSYDTMTMGVRWQGQFFVQHEDGEWEIVIECGYPDSPEVVRNSLHKAMLRAGTALKRFIPDTRWGFEVVK